MSDQTDDTPAETDDQSPDSADNSGKRTAGFDAPHETSGQYLNHRLNAMRAGELGALPIIIGLIGIAIVFGMLEEQFLTARNFTNLLLQMAPISFLAIGVVFILLIADGEVVSIDLSVAFVAAVGGTVLVLLQRPNDPGWPWWACILAAIAVTTAIGLLHSLIITKLGIPSFITTLAGLLVWSGVVLMLTTQFSSAGTIRIQDDTLVGLASNFLPDWLGWSIGVAVVIVYAAAQLTRMRSRQQRGLNAKPLAIVLGQIVAVAAITLGAVSIANSDRGVPQVTVTLAVFLAFWTFIASKTAFGRHIYAVGGNDEAARRAGINVDGVRIAVFMVNGFMAGVGGIILVSRLRSVATNTGGGNLLLNVIAAAVIGGTSLFGGHGRVVSAFYGALVITSIQNGMDLLGMASGTKFVVTGIVLLLAVLIDSVSKRRRSARGLA
ncbi:MAG: ABC transporter permease [Acidobacteria bacterium]|nr:ABC transporter permease [Acidobacteriota bacterium]